MGRAIVRDPKAFLMDEPLSNLDAKLRVQMRTQVARIQNQLETTMLYVTHDQTEAMTLGHRVAVMRAGIIQQVDTPKALYEDPVNLFVAGFIGSPAMNFIPARLEDGKVRLPFGDAPIPPGVESTKRDVIAGIRPEHFEDAKYGDDITDGLRFKTTVDVVESMGSELYAYFDIKGTQEVHSEQLDELAADAGIDDVPGGGATHIVARLDARSSAQHGREAEIILDTSQIMLFDMDGGRSLTTKA
jgi:multiple sugar transport system ATP-binding protein